MTALVADTTALLAKRPDLHLANLCDGARELWGILAERIDEQELGVEAVMLLDFWHVAEKLTAAFRVIGDEASRSRLTLLRLNRADAVDTILDDFWASGNRMARVGMSQHAHEAITNLENNHDLMNCATARQRHPPIGSGIAKATRKLLSVVRMKRARSRWKTESGDHVLHLRALALSDRWDHGVQLTIGHQPKPVRKVAARSQVEPSPSAGTS